MGCAKFLCRWTNVCILILVVYMTSAGALGVVSPTSNGRTTSRGSYFWRLKPRSASLDRSQSRVKRSIQQHDGLRMQDQAGIDSPLHVPPFLFTLNSATKWLVTLANGVGLLARPKSFYGPYIIAGAIVTSYLTHVLKRLINQGRPDGAPFTDPGMPSSHSLLSFFLATTWRQAYTGWDPVLWSAAATVASLRVLCGYHTIAQIVVGSGLGALLGQGWIVAGRRLYAVFPVWTHRVSLGVYVMGTVIFLRSNMRKWITEERHL